MTTEKIELRGCDGEIVAVGNVVRTETREDGQKVLVLEFTPTLKTRVAADMEVEKMHSALRIIVGEALRELGNLVSHG